MYFGKYLHYEDSDTKRISNYYQIKVYPILIILTSPPIKVELKYIVITPIVELRAPKRGMLLFTMDLL